MAIPLVKEPAIADLAIITSGAATTLRSDIVSRRARVGIVGLGYVGLPLGAAFAEAGFRVIGYDIDVTRTSSINAGQSPIRDVASSRITRLVEADLLLATADAARFAEADPDVVVICVPTPLTAERQPDLTYVVAASDLVARLLRRGQLVILESTTYPGTTREIVLPRLERTGLRVGEDVFLAFSPERVDPGNPRYGITNTPKVTGGMDLESTELATLFYRQAVETVVPVSSPEAAEMVKLLENTFRSVNIALVNEMALMCDRLGIDVWEVIDAAATKPFGFMPFFPGPGVGGHCIPLDPIYLAWKVKTLDYDARFIALASEINHERPRYVAARVIEALASRGRSVNGAAILILGVAYKPDIDDPRESPAIAIIDLLRSAGARVSYADPHVPSLALEHETLSAEPLTADRLEAADAVVVVTNHRAFDYEFVARHARLIIDTRNAVKRVDRSDAVVVRL